jgi:hypothetical protein
MWGSGSWGDARGVCGAAGALVWGGWGGSDGKEEDEEEKEEEEDDGAAPAPVLLPAPAPDGRASPVAVDTRERGFPPPVAVLCSDSGGATREDEKEEEDEEWWGATMTTSSSPSSSLFCADRTKDSIMRMEALLGGSSLAFFCFFFAAPAPSFASFGSATPPDADEADIVDDARDAGSTANVECPKRLV